MSETNIIEPKGSVEQTAVPSTNKKSILLPIIGSLVILFILALGVTSTLIAYDKIVLDNTELQLKVEDAVQGLPFMPKTPRFVIRKSIEAQNKIRRGYLDLSVATSSKGLSQVLGTSALDMSLTGPFDYTNMKKPKVDMNIQITDQFKGEIITNENRDFFKVEKLPTILFTLSGIDSKKVEKFYNKWISVKETTLDTEARKTVDDYSATETDTEKRNREKMTKIVNKEIIPLIKMNSETMDGASYFHIHTVISKKTMKRIELEMGSTDVLDKKTSGDISRFSDLMDDVTIDTWIAKDNYYAHKTAFSFRLNFPTTPGTPKVPAVSGLDPMAMTAQGPVSISAVIKISDLNKPVKIEDPKESMTSEEFMTELMKEFDPNYVAPTQQRPVPRTLRRYDPQYPSYAF